MKSNISFPHPVLGVNHGLLPDLVDDNCVLSDFKQSEQKYIYTFDLSFDNDQIKRYITEKKACYMCEVDCQATSYKKKILSDSPHLIVDVDRRDITGHLNFSFFVILKYAMPSYKNSAFNSDYRDPETGNLLSFYLETGSVLVMFTPYSENVSLRENNKLSVQSPIQIVRGTANDSVSRIDLNEQTIDVVLPNDLYDMFIQHNTSDIAGLYLSSIIQNALTYAILHIDEHSDSLWADSIKTVMQGNPTKFSSYSLDDPKDAVDISTNILAQQSNGDLYVKLFESIELLDE